MSMLPAFTILIAVWAFCSGITVSESLKNDGKEFAFIVTMVGIVALMVTGFATILIFA